MDVRPFAGEHLDDAAALLAERHARHREAEPLLPEAGDPRGQLERELGRERAAGVVALHGDELLAYLVGRVEADEHLGGTRAIVDLAGCAAREPEVVRDLYAALAAGWVAGGCIRHAAVVPASDAGLVDAWFRVAFGLQFTWAVRETAAEPAFDAHVAIRPGGPGDLEAAAALDRLLWEHQAAAPSFSGMTVPPLERFVDDWRDTWDDPETFTHFVAEREGRVVGHALLYRRPAGDLRVPPRNIDLAHVATIPDVRGSGAGRALTAHALAWAHERGFRSLTTDWRVVNLLSSRFWTRRGFRPTFLRLYRALP